MESLTSPISVQIDSQDKEIANRILKNLGLNMSTFVNMAIKQLINEDGIPFQVKNPKPSIELKRAIKEGEKILQDLENGKRKGYNNMDDLIESLNED